MSTVEHHVPIRTAAKRLGVHENTIRNWIDRGLLRAARLPSGIRRIALKDVERLEAEIFSSPTSFADMTMKRAPKPLPESAQERLNSYPDV
jgi:excisionase family DNA binding protein